MKTCISIVLTALILGAASSVLGAVEGNSFVHPGMLQNRSDLEFMKAKVLAGEQPWKGAWDRMLAASYSSLSFKPEPAEHVIRGAYGRPSIGSNELIASANAVESHSLQWYVTGNKAHAAKVIEIFNAWSPVLKDFQLNDAKLLAGWTGHQLLNAAEIIRYTDARWEPTDIEQFKKMILGVYYPLIKDFYPDANGNWDAAMMDTMLCIGIFCDDHAIFDRAVDHYLRGHLNGGITHYVYPSGQCQESTRDMAHTQLGLGEMAQACRVAWTQGVDLFGAADNRLALGYEYTAKYMLGEDVPCEGEISGNGRGRFSDIYWVVYDHYHDVLGVDLPYTAKAVGKVEPRSHTVLTMTSGPRSTSAMKKVAAPSAQTFALEGGAMNGPTTKPAATVIEVEAGGSLQKALDEAKGKGGWVVMGKGVFKFESALRMPSGVTLAGHGSDTIVWLDPQLSGPAIVNAEDVPRDITLRDFVIEGAVTTKLPTDPNADRRTRSRAGANARSGIIFAARGSDLARNLRVDHVTVRNCTQTGVEISSAAQVEIASCSFTDNGNETTDQEANLLLEQVTGFQVSHSRLNNSPAGCGIRVLGCRDANITSNEIARNVLDGIRISDSRSLAIGRNLIEGNEMDGVNFVTIHGESTKVGMDDNLIQNNGQAAIAKAYGSGEITEQGTRQRDNGKVGLPSN